MIRKWIWIVICCVCLIGCSQRIPLEKVSLILLIGLDRTPNGDIKVGTSIPLFHHKRSEYNFTSFNSAPYDRYAQLVIYTIPKTKIIFHSIILFLPINFSFVLYDYLRFYKISKFYKYLSSHCFHKVKTIYNNFDRGYFFLFILPFLPCILSSFVYYMMKESSQEEN